MAGKDPREPPRNSDAKSEEAEHLRRATSQDEEAERLRSAARIRFAAGEPLGVLGLNPGAGSAEIRRAFHRLALLHHPDKTGDEEVFKSVGLAYEALTHARDKEGGWQDLDKQAVGPWPAHTAKVNAILFDRFGGPPWESRRVFTASWDQANVMCWEVSAGAAGSQKPPRLVSKFEAGGFVNDIIAISPHGLVVGISAGMFPGSAEQLKVFDTSRVPFDYKIKGGGEPVEDTKKPKKQLEAPPEEDATALQPMRTSRIRWFQLPLYPRMASTRRSGWRSTYAVAGR